MASAVSFVLGAGLEVLVMAPSALNGTGNELDNTIFANDAPNISSAAAASTCSPAAAATTLSMAGPAATC